MTRTEKENLVPVWERITISLEEAAAYSGIGVRKLRDMTDTIYHRKIIEYLIRGRLAKIKS